MKISIPPSIQISAISSPCVCHFKDKQHRPEGPPHFYVIIPVNSATDLVLTMITSQVQSKIDYYTRTNVVAATSLIAVDGTDLQFLNRPSLIDCNSVELVPKAELSKKYDPAHGFEIKLPVIPDALKNQIVVAINNSPIVKPIIKKLLKQDIK
ncbi:MAG TPA: hypothetical protein HPP76_05545 [Desulfuromonadales bacterium]|nr:hypothetical protein [Desulfuromonadales bacterium]